MRAIIIGAGIGGLALTNGLQEHGIDVVVVDRDRDLSRTGGYQLHLGPTACTALSQLLSPTDFDQLTNIAAKRDGFRISVRDHRGRLLARAADAAPGASLDVDRLTLRLALAKPVMSTILTGAEYVSHAVDTDGIEVTLADGRQLRGNVLIAADGANSSVVPCACGKSASTTTGLIGIAGRTPWQDVPESVRDLLNTDPMLAIGPGGTGLFATRHDPPREFRSAGATLTPAAVLIWGVIAVDTRGVRHQRAMAHDLRSSASTLLSSIGWLPDLAAAVHAADPETVAQFRLLAAHPDHIAHWAAGPLTGLGDAAHAMPPTGGQGAATAIRDAALLTRWLAEAAHGRLPVERALRCYEAEMIPIGAAAVRESLAPVKWIHASATPVGQLLTRAALPTLAAARAVLDRIRGHRP